MTFSQPIASQSRFGLRIALSTLACLCLLVSAAAADKRQGLVVGGGLGPGFLSLGLGDDTRENKLAGSLGAAVFVQPGIDVSLAA